MLGCRCCHKRAMKAQSPSLVAMGIPPGGDKCQNRTCPPAIEPPCALATLACENFSPASWPKDNARQQVVRVEDVEIGRRRVPSGGVRAQSVGRERGVNDPGVARPVRPAAFSVGVVHALRFDVR
jgi:hypothetical protein